ncbi:MAG: 16S rRNA (uracil(1498)-N(3))-methyltransferase [Proteobacteria bacterium]|nr:16S rRNA (uracil(1498)-N(3))-methyltransferase [Pseudomonadota bacterium]
MRYFFIEQPADAGSTSLIAGADARHIKTVLRLKPGDKIGLFDGKGSEYEARIIAVSSGRVEVAVARRFPAFTESPLHIIVAQAYLKEKKMDGLVRQLTELGVSRWIPFFADRSVPRPAKNQLAARTQRWEKITKEALKQCRRGRLLDIGAAVSFETVLDLGQTCDLKIIFWEDEIKPAHDSLPQPGQRFEKILVMLGPEGGFTAREIESAQKKGFVTAALGPRTLRAETATVAACVLLQYLYGDMGATGTKKS